MENKQTAVEWLVANIDWQLLRNTKTHYNMIVEKAKAMEKEQIMGAWDNGWHEHMNPPNTYITSVKYYNETFKSE